MFASNTNHQQVFRPLNNNENLQVSAKNNDVSASKTPAASSKQRRALGDISNRKQGRSDQNRGVTGKKVQTPGIRLAQQHQHQQPQQQRILLSTKTPAVSKRTEVSFLPRPTQVKPTASKVNILPDAMKNKAANERPAVQQKSILKNNNVISTKSNTTVDDPVDDIEKPAGRLWIDEPDDDSIASVSLPGALTVREDWEAACKKRFEYQLKLELEEEQREEEEFEAYQRQLFEDDESIVGANVWIERTLSFDTDLDEELSFDAPSCCVDISF